MTNPVFLKMKQTFSSTTQGLSKNDKITTISEMITFLSAELQALNQPTTKPKSFQEIVAEKKEASRQKYANAMTQFNQQNRDTKEKELLAAGCKLAFKGEKESWFSNPKSPGYRTIVKQDGTVTSKKI